MGAQTFSTTAKGRTAQAAFSAAVKSAGWEHGHGGYTGTIAEKSSFTLIRDSAEEVLKRLLKEPDAEKYYPRIVEGLQRGDGWAIARALVEIGDPRIDDKWGAAGCIALGDGEWLFFGWASS